MNVINGKFPGFRRKPADTAPRERARLRVNLPRWHRKARTPASSAPAEFLGRYRAAALRVIALVVTAATSVALAESYRGLYLWSAGHGVPGIFAYAWPLMVDTFVVIGELALFIGLIDGWEAHHRTWAWTVTAGGLVVSVLGNVGHVGAASWADRLTAAVPPLAAFIALTVSLGVLKRAAERAAAIAAAADEPQSLTALAALEWHPETLADQATQADAVRFALWELARSANIPTAEVKAREVADFLNARRAELADPEWPLAPSYIADIQRRDAARNRTAA